MFTFFALLAYICLERRSSTGKLKAHPPKDSQQQRRGDGTLVKPFPGHGRLLPARKLGLPEVPVVALDHLTDTQRRAYIIADNKLSENAGWDEEVLATELAHFERDGLDLKLVGFSDEELEALRANQEDDFHKRKQNRRW